MSGWHGDGGKRENAAMVRRRKVAEFRAAGINDQTVIAKQLNVAPTTISGDFKVVDQWYREAAAADIAKEKGKDLVRLEAAIKGLWPAVLRGDVRSVAALIRVLERKSALLGMDASRDINHNYPGGAPSFTITAVDYRINMAKNGLLAEEDEEERPLILDHN